MLSQNPGQFSSSSRVLLFAPHPDDETLGCGALLQRAVAAQAEIRVSYATDGENNPWPQRVLERKWTLRASDRLRWGGMRRTEALAALNVLGINPGQAQFLGLPDQKLATVFKRCREPLLEYLAEIVHDFQPTHLFVTSTVDTHSDHRALGVMLRLVLQKYFVRDNNIETWCYVVHGRNRSFHHCATALPQSKTEIERKRLAISCHKSQIKLSGRRFFAYADRPEKFLYFAPSFVRSAEPVISGIPPEHGTLLLVR